MRTAKKTLCLVLVFAMMLSLCVFASADVTKVEDYTDYADIPAQYKQATTILTAIEVFNGYAENDAFQGTEKLTRAQGAKIIAVMLGFKDSMAATKASNFTDMGEAEWAIPYVNAGVERGIIAGYGDGRFGPNDPLTGTQFAKMLLTALGYDAEKQGLIGSGWDVNTAILANSADSRLIPSEATYGAFPYTENIDRFTAAQMAYNTLILPMVRYTGSNTAWDFETSSARASQTISSRVINAGATLYMVEFAERYFPQLVRITNNNDVFGAPATKWTLNGKTICENALEPIYESYSSPKGKEVFASYENLLQGDSLFQINRAVVIYVDGVELIDIDDNVNNNDAYDAYERLLARGVNDTFAGRGTLVQVFFDDELYNNNAGYDAQGNVRRVGIVTIVIKHTWLAEVVADEKDGKVDLAVIDAPAAKRTGTLKEDVDKGNVAGLKRGDMVRVTMANGTVQTVDLADDDINVGITAYSANADETKMDSVKKDGETVQVAEMAFYHKDILFSYTLEQLLGFTYDIYYDQYGYLLGIEFNKRDTSYVFVTGIDVEGSVLGNKTYKASVIWTDGKFETIPVKVTKNGTANDLIGADDEQALNTWFICAKNDAGEVTLRDVVGNADADKGVQQASVRRADEEFEPQINTAHKSLPVNDAGKVVNGNENTVYILAAADNSVVDPMDDTVIGAIVDTTSCVKGIKNVSINCMDLETEYKNAQDVVIPLTAFETPSDLTAYTTGWREGYSDTFFVYDVDTGYVLYAVVVAESAPENLVYITRSVKESKLVDGFGYVDIYEAIVNGEKVDEFKVVRDKTGTNTAKLLVRNFYFVSYDESGEYVIDVDGALAPAEVNTDAYAEGALRAAGYAIVTGLTRDPNQGSGCVTLDGKVLWLMNEDEDVAITLDDSCRFYVGLETASKNDGYKEYATADLAITAANSDPNLCITTMFVDINAKGWAETIIFLRGEDDAVEVQVAGEVEGFPLVIEWTVDGVVAQGADDTDDQPYQIAPDGTYYIIGDTVELTINNEGLDGYHYEFIDEKLPYFDIDADPTSATLNVKALRDDGIKSYTINVKLVRN